MVSILPRHLQSTFDRDVRGSGRARICRPVPLIGFAGVSKSYEAAAKIC